MSTGRVELVLTKPGDLLASMEGAPEAERRLVGLFLEDLLAAGAKIASAAKRWLQLSPEAQAWVAENLPAHMRPFLGQLQRIGTGRLHPLLYASSGWAAQALGRLPIEEQERYLTELMPVAVQTTEGGRWDTRKMDVVTMTPAVRQQVFEKLRDGVWRVRTVAEQRAWVQEQRTQAAAAKLTRRSLERPGKWTLKGARVYPDADRVKTGFGRKDLLQMLRDLEE